MLTQESWFNKARIDTTNVSHSLVFLSNYVLNESVIDVSLTDGVTDEASAGRFKQEFL